MSQRLLSTERRFQIVAVIQDEVEGDLLLLLRMCWSCAGKVCCALVSCSKKAITGWWYQAVISISLDSENSLGLAIQVHKSHCCQSGPLKL